MLNVGSRCRDCRYCPRTGPRALYLRAFLLTVGFQNPGPDAAELVAESFEAVHEAAAENELSETAWLLLEPLLPSLGVWRDWDRCKRLRRALLVSIPANSISHSGVFDHPWVETSER